MWGLRTVVTENSRLVKFWQLVLRCWLFYKCKCKNVYGDWLFNCLFCMLFAYGKGNLYFRGNAKHVSFGKIWKCTIAPALGIFGMISSWIVGILNFWKWRILCGYVSEMSLLRISAMLKCILSFGRRFLGGGSEVCVCLCGEFRRQYTGELLCFECNFESDNESRGREWDGSSRVRRGLEIRINYVAL